MEETNRLYPLKFKPQIFDKIWGGHKLRDILNKPTTSDKAGETWEISAVQGNISEVTNGFLAGNDLQELIEVYMGDLVGDKVYKKFGIEFPLLIKFIDAGDVLSIQVHPDDELAKERHNSYGKTEMWYIVQADPGSKLIVGFQREMDKETYLRHLEQKTLDQILNTEEVKEGNVYFLPAGRIHAIGKGILLAEIQQTSDVTYRIFDFDRKDARGKPRELHTDLALDAIDYRFYNNYETRYNKLKDTPGEIISCKYFTTNILHISREMERDMAQIDSFVIYMCLEGEVDITYYETQKMKLSKGETVLIPAEIESYFLSPAIETKLLEVYIP